MIQTLCNVCTKYFQNLFFSPHKRGLILLLLIKWVNNRSPPGHLANWWRLLSCDYLWTTGSVQFSWCKAPDSESSISRQANIALRDFQISIIRVRLWVRRKMCRSLKKRRGSLLHTWRKLKRKLLEVVEVSCRGATSAVLTRLSFILSRDILWKYHLTVSMGTMVGFKN